MIKYNSLLSEIAAQFGIRRGAGESEGQYKQRICYSAAGVMGYASLWDIPEDEECISMDHFKKRIRNVLDSYAALYPEIGDSLQGTLPDEICSLYQSTGFVYHSPFRLSPAAFSIAENSGVQFLRGCSVNQIRKVSGIGIFDSGRGDQGELSVESMFRLNPALDTIWTQWISGAHWEERNGQITGEFLRTAPPFYDGYWQFGPEKGNKITLVRTGLEGNRQYYLYRRDEDKTVYTAQLPEWLVAGENYLLIANAIMDHYGTLPPTVFTRLGSVVKIRLGYLYPPEELNFFRLYSWPEKLLPKPDAFSRIMDADVFWTMKCILENKGYKFKEG